MKQIVIVIQNGVPYVSGITDSDQSIEPELTESLVQRILDLNIELDKIKQPEQVQQELIRDYIKQTATDEQLIEFAFLFDEWVVGVDYEVGDLFVHESQLYRVIQPIRSMAHQPPEQLPAHYRRIAPPGVIEPWRQPQGAHDAYQEDDKVTHKDKTWISTAKDNVWEPGVYGWDII